MRKSPVRVSGNRAGGCQKHSGSGAAVEQSAADVGCGRTQRTHPPLRPRDGTQLHQSQNCCTYHNQNDGKDSTDPVNERREQRQHRHPKHELHGLPGAPLTSPDHSTFDGGDGRGYLDYPTLDLAAVE